MAKSNSPLALDEIEKFIAGTRDIVPEKVVLMMKERTLSFDEVERWDEVFLPLIDDLRERLNERGIVNPGSLASLNGHSRRIKPMLESLAYLLNQCAHGLAYRGGASDDIQPLALEAESIGKLLNDPNITTVGSDLIASAMEKQGNVEGAIARYRGSYAIGIHEDNPEIVARSLHNLGALLSDNSRYREAIEALQEAYDALKSVEGSVDAKGLILYRLASAYQYVGDVVKGLEVLYTANKLLTDGNSQPIKLMVLTQFAYVFRQSGQYREAIEKYKEAIALAGALSDVQSEAEHLVGLARVYSAIGEPDEGMKLFKAAIKKYESSDAVKEAGLIEARFGDVLASEGEYEEALNRYTRSLSSMRSGSYNASGRSYLYTVIGDMQTKLGQYDTADQEYQKGLDVACEAGLTQAIFNITLRQAHLARLSGKSRQAILLYKQVLELIDEDQQISEQTEVHRWLSVLYKDSKNYKGALHHFEEHHRLMMILQEGLLDERLNSLRVTHKVEEYRKEAELERLQRKQSEAELQHVTLQLTEKGELIGSVRKRVREILKDLENEQKPILVDALKQIIRHVNEQNTMNEKTLVYLRSVDEEYYERLQGHHPDLTSGQIRLCGLLRSGMNNLDIAGVLHITLDGLNKQRYRLRKALGLTRKQRLEGYLGKI